MRYVWLFSDLITHFDYVIYRIQAFSFIWVYFWAVFSCIYIYIYIYPLSFTNSKGNLTEVAFCKFANLFSGFTCVGTESQHCSYIWRQVILIRNIFAICWRSAGTQLTVCACFSKGILGLGHNKTNFVFVTNRSQQRKKTCCLQIKRLSVVVTITACLSMSLWITPLTVIVTFTMHSGRLAGSYCSYFKRPEL